MNQLAKMMIVFGLVIAAVGLFLLVGERLGLGKLPGDLVWKRKNVTVYFPIVTSVVLSIVLTVVLNLLSRK